MTTKLDPTVPGEGQPQVRPSDHRAVGDGAPRDHGSIWSFVDAIARRRRETFMTAVVFRWRNRQR